MLVPEFQAQNILSLSETFDRTVIEKLLAKQGCTAIRIYYGMDEDKKVHAILVASNANNADILGLPSNAANATGENDDDDESIVDRGIRCPVICPEDSPLNQDAP